MGSNRIPRGFSTVSAFREVSEGIRPHEELYPAKYLPVQTLDKHTNDYFVIEGGTIVAIEASGFAPNANTGAVNGLVNCNGGTASMVTYAAADVGITIDIDDTDSYVTAAGIANTNLAANKPIGVAPYSMYQATMQDLYNNYVSGVQDKVTVLTNYYIEVPYITAVNDANGTLAPGDRVMSDASGNFVQWDGSDASQIVGVLWVKDTTLVKDNLDKVLTVAGLSLPGSGTSGVAGNLNVSGATGALRIKLTL